MIRVKMDIRNDGFCVAIEGHAEDEVKRNPLVCAAASMLMTTFAQVMKNVESNYKRVSDINGYKIAMVCDTKLEPGDSYVKMDLSNLCMYPNVINNYIKFFKVGIELLVDTYGDLVRLEYDDNRNYMGA